MGNLLTKESDNADFLLQGNRINLDEILKGRKNLSELEQKEIFERNLGEQWFQEIFGDEFANVDKDNENERKSRRNFAERHTRNRGYAIGEMNALTENKFRRMFRLSKDAFNHVLKLITPIIRSKLKFTAGFGKYHRQLEPIPPKVKLAATLRWLAGGSYLDICFAFGLSSSIFYNVKDGVLWPTMEAIHKVLKIDFPIDDMEKLEKISNGFSCCVGGAIKGVVLAVDGWVETLEPREIHSIIIYRG